jgi:nucleotide-binding universal stress UspA family protein
MSMLQQGTSVSALPEAGPTIRKILVPTDGSPLSERALPIATAIASAHGAEVTLARVIEPPAWFPVDAASGFPADGPIYQQTMELVNREARQQLDPIADRLHAHGVAARTAILQGQPALQLLQLEGKVAADLVIIASHGRTGVRRLAQGSIADELVREGSVPVLVVPSFGDERAISGRAIVPHDGSELADDALSLVRALAGKPITAICLFRSVASPEEEGTAIAELNHVERELPDSITRAEIVVREGDPAVGILAAAEPGDLIVMATHGRGGLDRFWHGSVAQRVLQRARVPVLLVRTNSDVDNVEYRKGVV